MPRARTSLISLAGLLALVVLALWQVPQHLDWRRYRASLEALAFVTLGQPVTIHGPISLSLLPQPVLTAAQVDIGGNAPADASIRVQALRLRVALWPLLGGRIDARELVLRGADLRIPWPAQPGALPVRAPGWLLAFRARIENGTLSIGQITFTGVDANVDASDSGALSASGSAVFNGQPWQFTARTGAIGGDAPTGIEATLDGQGPTNGLGVRLAGQMQADGSFSGTLSGRGPNLALLIPAPAVPFRAEGRLTVGDGRAAIDEISLQLAGSPAKAAVALRVRPAPRLDVALSATRLDLDAWLPALLAAHTTIAGVALPLGIDVSAEAAQLGGGTLQHVQATLELRDAALTLREARALLPGNAELRVSGRMERRDASPPEFEGDAHLSAPVLRSTLQWLQRAVPGLLPAGIGGLVAGVLQTADVSAHVVGDVGQVSLQRLAGRIDATAIAGSIAFKRGSPPALVVDGSADDVRLDDWLAAWPISSGFDAALHLNIAHATLAGHAIRNAGVDASIEAGNILLRHLDAAAEGMHVTASGELTKGGQLNNATLNLDANDATPLATMLPRPWRATPALWLGPVQLSVQASGPPTALAVGITLSLADASVSANPTIDLRHAGWSGDLTLRHPGARRLVSAIGWPDVSAWLDDGSLSLVAHLHGAPNRISADSFSLTAGDIRIGGDIDFQQDKQWRARGHLHADSLPLPLPNAGSNQPLPIDALRGWQGEFGVSVGRLFAGSLGELRDVTANASVADGTLHIQALAAQLDGGTLTGGFMFNGSATPPSLALDARLDGTALHLPDGLALDLTAGEMAGHIDLNASGFSPATLLATLTGHVVLAVNDGAVSGFDLVAMKSALQLPDAVAAQKSAADALGTGTTEFDRLDIAGSLAHGDFVLDSAKLRGSAGEAEATGDVNLPNRSLDIRIALRPALNDPPNIAIRLSGPIDQPQRTPELANLVRFMAERAH